MKRKPIFAVMFFGKLQPVKATDEQEAKSKFLKAHTKVSEEDIYEVFEIETTHKHFNHFRTHAI